MYKFNIGKNNSQQEKFGENFLLSEHVFTRKQTTLSPLRSSPQPKLLDILYVLPHTYSFSLSVRSSFKHRLLFLSLFSKYIHVLRWLFQLASLR